MAKFKNALDKITQLLDPKNNSVLQETYRLITENPMVIVLGTTFSCEALREFFHAFRAGMIYAAAQYEKSIPDDISFYRAPKYQGYEFDKLVYRGSEDGTTDEIAMSHAYIASHCMAIEYGTLGRFSDHLPPKDFVQMPLHARHAMLSKNVTIGIKCAYGEKQGSLI